MGRRLVVSLALVLVLAAPAAADLSHRKASIDDKIAALRGRVAAYQARERVLRGEIAAVTTQIRALQRRVGDVSLRYDSLRRDLYLHEVRLHRLQELYRVQSERVGFLHEQYRLAIEHLGVRLRNLYEDGTPGTLDVVFSAASFSDMLEQLDYVKEIGRQDRLISREVEAARVQVAKARRRTARSRDGVRAATRTVAVRTQQVAQVRNALLHDRNALAARRHVKSVRLASLSQKERDDISEIDALEHSSQELAVRIRAAQAPPADSSGAPDVSPSAAGLVWPVSGPITSPFGWRWGRMHQGIDIGVGYGVPIHAAASGTIIYAGWMSGYGNLVVVDHGGGISTAYGHQSSIAVGNGQAVSQGQVLGYVGCTGHCFGPHLHFEVRVNGAPVDPLGYL